jgi:hypothetical protein
MRFETDFLSTSPLAAARMFAMHESTRRFFCRVGFLLFCVLPTLLVGTWIVSRHTDWFGLGKSSWESALSEQIGLSVRLGKVANPRPGVMLFQDVELADPETAQVVARARLVETANTDRGLVLLASQPEIEADQIQRLWEVVHDRMLRGRSSTDRPLQLLASELTLRGPQRSPDSPADAQSFSDVRCLVETADSGPQATIQFRLAGRETANPAQLRVVRNRQLAPATTRWELHTGSAPLPCAIFAAYVEPLAQLGDDCEFHGIVWAERTADGWEGDLTGRFTSVDFERLITEQFPHKLSGVAEVTFSRAKFRRGRLVEAAGGITNSSGGTVSPSLLTAIAESLQLKPAERTEQLNSGPIAYRQFACGFEITADGLSVIGHCDAQGTVLSDNAGPLLSSVSQSPQPVVALVRALVPQSDIQVPATLETDTLLRALPVPSVLTPRELEARVPYSPLRLRN